MLRFAALILTVPLAAQSSAGKWTFGAYGNTHELTGHLKDFSDEQKTFDIQNDLNLKTDKTGTGVHMGYLGSRFGFSVDYGVQDYAGKSTINRTFKIGDQYFGQQTDVTSSLKNSAFDLTGTVKIFNIDKAWLGVNLGLQVWYLDVKAQGTDQSTSTVIEEGAETFPAPIPQIGISGGFQCLQDQLVLKGKLHFLSYSGANYTRFFAEASYYFLPWLGARAFADLQSLKVPTDSIASDLELKLERNGFGVGIVARW
jgi:hypothetical protein